MGTPGAWAPGLPQSIVPAAWDPYGFPYGLVTVKVAT
jgi:hypothetical protein